MGQGLEELCAASMAAVERCVHGCGGVEMETLLRSLEDGFVTYFEAAASSVEQCRPEDPAVGYALLALADECTTQFNMTNAATRTKLLALRTQLHPSSTDTSTAILRRVGKLYCALDGRRSARLAATLGESLFRKLPTSALVSNPERVAAERLCGRCSCIVYACRQTGW